MPNNKENVEPARARQPSPILNQQPRRSDSILDLFESQPGTTQEGSNPASKVGLWLYDNFSNNNGSTGEENSSNQLAVDVDTHGEGSERAGEGSVRAGEGSERAGEGAERNGEGSERTGEGPETNGERAVTNGEGAASIGEGEASNGVEAPSNGVVAEESVVESAPNHLPPVEVTTNDPTTLNPSSNSLPPVDVEATNNLPGRVQEGNNSVPLQPKKQVYQNAKNRRNLKQENYKKQADKPYQAQKKNFMNKVRVKKSL